MLSMGGGSLEPEACALRVFSVLVLSREDQVKKQDSSYEKILNWSTSVEIKIFSILKSLHTGTATKATQNILQEISWIIDMDDKKLETSEDSTQNKKG